MVSAVLLEQIPWAGIQWLEQTVEVVLGIMAIFVVTVVVEKYIRVGRVRRISGVYAPQVASAFRANNWDKAIALSEVYADRAHLARVVYSGLKEREKLNERRLAEPLIARHINEAMAREIIAVGNEYKQNIGGVEAIGRTAPFVGALGGSALTFALGIALAVPSIWIATYLLSWISSLEGDMKYAASEFTTYVEQAAVESQEKAERQ